MPGGLSVRMVAGPPLGPLGRFEERCGMISETALSKVCRPAILGRASIISQRQGRIWKRSCSYDGSITRVRARVDSASGYEEYYEAGISFDETADTVLDYSCTCPAARRFPGPCKHSVALALDFNRNGREFDGFDKMQHVSTSSVLSEILVKAAAAPRVRPPSDTGEHAGSIVLEPTLVRDRSIFLRLRVAGGSGAYVVKRIGDFADHVASASFYEYGKMLAFTHSIDMFEPVSQRLARFIVRAVQNRRSYSAERLVGRIYATPGVAPSSMGRDLRLSGPELDELLEMLVGTGVTFEDVRRAGSSSRTLRLEVCDGDPEVGLSVETAGEGTSFEVVRQGEADFFSSDEKLYAISGETLFRCTPRLRMIAPFLTSVYASTAPHLLLSEQDAPRFAATLLPRLEAAMPVSAPKEMEALRPEPMRLEFYLDRTRARVTCDVQAVYGEKRYHIAQRHVGASAQLGRDLESETNARQLVGRYFTLGKSEYATISDRNADAIARLVFEGVGELRRLGEVFSTSAFDGLVATTSPRVRVGLAVRANLINLTVSADDLPLSELHALLGSYRRHQRFHRLRDGSFVDLSRADLSEAARLADELGLSAHDLAAGRVEIPSYKAFLLDSITSDSEKDESFVSYIENFRSVDPTSYDLPASLAARLRPYQVKGFQWLFAICDMGFGGILSDEMGLGKSAQLISLLLARRGEGCTLVACPASLVYNWKAEFEKFAPELDVALVVGNAAERCAIRQERPHDVLVTSYDLLRRDIEDYARMDFWCEVLDEAQYIKNHETLAARATKAVTAEHRLALTGTPIENRLSELWSIFDFLMPGLLGSYDRFRERYEQPIADGDEEVAARLRALIAPFVLRRRKAEVLNDLPDKLEQVIYARMDGEQLRLYRAHEQALRLSLTEQSDSAFNQGKLQVLAELTRLRQICCDPRLVYDDYDSSSAKLDTILSLVSSAADAQAKMLVFSQFTSYLDVIAGRLDDRGVRYYMLTGSTPKKRRLELVDAFNHDDTPVFLISLKAGGTGLNLVGASVVVHADPWWNAAAQNQATDRAHRIGQTRDVTVYKVIAKDTIEDRILALQEAKSDIAEQIVGEGGGASLASLRKEDLIDLLGE